MYSKIFILSFPLFLSRQGYGKATRTIFPESSHTAMVKISRLYAFSGSPKKIEVECEVPPQNAERKQERKRERERTKRQEKRENEWTKRRIFLIPFLHSI